MKSLTLLIGLALAVLCQTAAAQTENGLADAPRLLNRIVAVVNDDIIVLSELDEEMVSISAELQKKDTQLPPRTILEKQVLERLIVERLQLQLAENSGIRIDDTTLNSKLQELAKANGVTLTQFRDVLERDGYDYAGFREDLRKEMVINQLRQQMVGSRIKVSEQEVENLLATLGTTGQGDAEYHLAHILIAVPEAARPEQIQAAQQRASQVLANLAAGADFSRTAIAESDGQTALDGGDIGWRSLGQMPTLFVEPLKTLQPGEVSELIRSPSGFHIIKLVEQRGGERYVVNQTRVRHILLKPDALHSDEETRLRLQQLAQRIRSGEDFAALARSNSQDTLSAAKGGELGWVNPGDLVPAFEETMNRLPPGQLSQVFKSEFGWHVLEVLERREHDSTEEYKHSRARQLIRSRKGDEQLLLWLRRLRDESYVEYRLES
jgi:peptidyl-prolyl cis-trans isomerase SurA